MSIPSASGPPTRWFHSAWVVEQILGSTTSRRCLGCFRNRYVTAVLVSLDVVEKVVAIALVVVLFALIERLVAGLTADSLK